MKKITELWLNVAFDDLVAAKQLLSVEGLTNLVAFHSQQCIEKSMKALLEEKTLPDSRYPGDTGLLPEGKPTSDEAMFFVTFAEEVYSQIKMHLETKYTI
jgi:hypothetical protein